MKSTMSLVLSIIVFSPVVLAQQNVDTTKVNSTSVLMAENKSGSSTERKVVPSTSIKKDDMMNPMQSTTDSPMLDKADKEPRKRIHHKRS
ncbi:hypothetical protein [Vibrio rarus]|uniref:hypothetical protein n=1 Tax=Vibrio rarus TaxID=413403 RepID=UPI0021C30A72|nr:hypothetical protein [Vibrio rarus]